MSTMEDMEIAFPNGNVVQIFKARFGACDYIMAHVNKVGQVDEVRKVTKAKHMTKLIRKWSGCRTDHN